MVFFEVSTLYEVLSSPFWGVLYEEGLTATQVNMNEREVW